MPKLLSDDQITEGTNSLNLNQRENFNVFHKWAKDYVKCYGNNEEPLTHVYFAGKSKLAETIHNVISETLLYRCKDPEKPRVFLLGSARISAVTYGKPVHLTLELNLEQRYLV